MSYILDALKKSERERPAGPVPDLFTVHGPLPPSSRRPARAIVLVALLLVVPAIVLWAWIGTGRQDDAATRPPPDDAVPQTRAAAPAALAAPVAPRAVAAPTAPVKARTAVATAARGPAGERSSPPAPPAQKPLVAAPSLAIQTTVPAAVTAPAAAAPAAAPAAQVISPEPAAAAAAAAEQEPPADGRSLALDELPAPIRAELPKLLVSGHVWSDEPALRLLSVDDRLLREGGEAAPGVRLQEITPAGALFVFKGWRFRVAGGRP